MRFQFKTACCPSRNVIQQPSNIVITLMNPQSNVHVNAWQPGKLTLGEFVQFQNGWLARPGARARGPSSIYLNCNRFTSLYLNGVLPPQGSRYSVLHAHAAVIDWLPFYSRGFRLTPQYSLPKDYLLKLVFGLAAAATEGQASESMVKSSGTRVICVGKDIVAALETLFRPTRATAAGVARERDIVGMHLVRFGRSTLPVPLYGFPSLARQGVANVLLEQAAADLRQDA